MSIALGRHGENRHGACKPRDLVGDNGWYMLVQLAQPLFVHPPGLETQVQMRWVLELT